MASSEEDIKRVWGDVRDFTWFSIVLEALPRCSDSMFSYYLWFAFSKLANLKKINLEVGIDSGILGSRFPLLLTTSHEFSRSYGKQKPSNECETYPSISAGKCNKIKGSCSSSAGTRHIYIYIYNSLF